MTTREPGGCADINVKGAYPVELEVREDGTRRLACPCCQGSGEHGTLAGSGPGDPYYPCWTCGGEGDLDPVILTAGEKQERRREPGWEGVEISNRLSIRSDGDVQDWWNIHGKWDGQCGMGSTREAVRLARLILDRLEPVETLDRLQWVKDYRRLNQKATLQQAMAAWDREHPHPAAAWK